MIKTIIKRDGRREDFSPSKINAWGEWASKTLGTLVDWSSVVLETVSVLPEEVTSEFLHDRLIRTCLDRGTWSYNRMAGRLYAALIFKEFYGDVIPTIKSVHSRLFEDGLMVKLDYSEEEYLELEGVINHKLDYKSAYFELLQLRKKYALQNRTTGEEYESQQFVYMRMAMALSETQSKDRRMNDVKKFYEHFSQKRINAPTPNYINLGTPQRGYSSCCVFTTKDTASSIEAGSHIAYTMTVQSAGIGAHLGVRSINDPVKSGAIAHMGKLPYYRYIMDASKANMQAGRGGAVTMFHNCFDPEIEVLNQLKNPMTVEERRIRGMDYAFTVNKFFARKAAKNEEVFSFNPYTAPDLYEAFYSSDQEEFERLYKKYEDNPEFEKSYFSARDTLIEALNQGLETGRNYIFWVDEANTHTPFKDKIYSSNLCVAPETKILTSKGYEVISNLRDQTIEVWNGEEWSETTVVKTGRNQKLLKVVTNSGYELECTPYHKFYIFDGYGKPYKEVRAKDLISGDKLAKFDLPVIHGDRVLSKAYTNGFFSGDGCVTPHGDRVYLYHDKRELEEFIEHDGSWRRQPEQKRIYTYVQGLKEKYFVPTEEYTVETRLTWLSGYFDADGCVYRNGSTQQIVASSTEYTFLQEVQLMLQTLGVSSKITKLQDEGYRPLPKNDGSGEYGEYYCKDSWRLLITSYDLYRLLQLGLKFNRLEVVKTRPQKDAKQFVKVVGVIDEGRFDDTYCFTEPRRHMGMFNGILTGQCLEIDLPTKGYNSVKDLYSDSEEIDGEIGLCSLAGIVHSNVDSEEQLEEVMYYALLMIDKCIHLSEFPFNHLEMTAKSRLSAGIGIVGLAHYLAKRKLSYTSQEGKDEIHRLAERHMYFAIKASLKLSKEFGVASWMNKTKWVDGWLPIDTYNKSVDSVVSVGMECDWESLREEIIANGGIRNSVLVAHMPSESSSISSGTTNGLYPIRDLAMNKGDSRNINYWAATDGERLAKYYDIAWDIPTKDLVDMYSIVQKFTDQGISADTYVKLLGDSRINSAELLKDFFYMTKMGLKSKYYMNSKTSDGSALGIGTEEEFCESCTL